MIDINEIESALHKLISADFSEVNIIKVNVTPDVDYDGDEILRIEVIFDGEPNRLQGSVMAQAIRKIRPTLQNMNSFAFPSLSFMTREDAGIPART